MTGIGLALSYPILLRASELGTYDDARVHAVYFLGGKVDLGQRQMGEREQSKGKTREVKGDQGR